FLFLAVDADGGKPGGGKRLALLLDMLELQIAIGVGWAGVVLAVGLGSNALAAQQTADGIGTGLVALFGQIVAEMPQAPPDPLAVVRRIAGGVVGNQLGQILHKSGIFSSAAGRPAPSRRTRSRGRSCSLFSSSVRPRRMVSTCM